MNTANALKVLVKVGLKVFLPGIGDALATAAEEGGGLVIDEVAARRSRDVHARILRTLESSFNQFAASEGLSSDQAMSALELVRSILSSYGIRAGEWEATRFDGQQAAAIVLNRAGLQASERSRIEMLMRAYYDALLADQQSLTALEAQFRSSVLASIDRLAQEINWAAAAGRPDHVSAIAASALISTPAHIWRRGVSAPGALLRADIDGGVPFHGRDAELADLDAWRDCTDPLSLRLYVGPGGLGKTRLMIEACRRAATAGWQAGFVSNRAKEVPASVWSALVRVGCNSLLVVDYAETRTTEVSELVRAAGEAASERRLRLVLLARHAGDWWQQLKSASSALSDLLYGNSASDPIRLRPLASDAKQRAAAYSLAYDTFAERLGVAHGTIGPIDLAAPYFDRILLLHMQALAAVEGVQTTGDRGLLDYVLARERRFWTQLATERRIPAYVVPGIAQAMAIVTLQGGVRTEQDTHTLFGRVPSIADQSYAVRDAISATLHEAYPGERWIEPVLPDLLGEHLVQAELDDNVINLVFGARGEATLDDG